MSEINKINLEAYDSCTQEQKEIVKNFFENDFKPLLEKDVCGSFSFAPFPKTFCLAEDGLKGSTNFGRSFEFRVYTFYAFSIPYENSSGQGLGAVKINSDETQISLGDKDIQLPEKPHNLFGLRNSLTDDPSLSILQQVIESYNDSKFQSGFIFGARSEKRKDIEALMSLDHTNAEKVIKTFLETIDNYFIDYVNDLNKYKHESKSHEPVFEKFKELFKKENIMYEVGE